MKDFGKMTAVELSGLYRRGEVSPVEIVDDLFERLERSGPALNAFCAFDRRAAREAAGQSASRWRDGAPKSPIDGIPVSIKDNIAVAGMPTLFGSCATERGRAFLPDSPSASRLREAGAVIFGKTTLPDFAHKIVTDSPLTGITRNPWNLDHTPGGSSGGAAAAVAAGLGPLALGTDGGGSIRIPAAFTGLFGFKPSFGRVPHSPRGAFALLSHVGPMTRTVGDALLMMNVVTRSDSRDWYALPAQKSAQGDAPARGLAGARVAYSPTLGLAAPTIDPEIHRLMKNAANKLADLGAIVEQADPPHIDQCLHVSRVMWTSFSARLARSLGERRIHLDPSLEALARKGEALAKDAFLEALLMRGELGAKINAFFESYRFVLCPTFHRAAIPLAEIDPRDPPTPTFTSWCNLLGLPAANLFCGFTRDGLPVGLQIVGPQYRDFEVLDVSAAVEAAMGTSGYPKWHS